MAIKPKPTDHNGNPISKTAVANAFDQLLESLRATIELTDVRKKLAGILERAHAMQHKGEITGAQMLEVYFKAHAVNVAIFKRGAAL